MEKCIFCQIVNSQVPTYKIYEDKNFLGFLDIYPSVKGHTLVIPKKHYRWVYDVPNFDEYWKVVLTVTKAIQNSLTPKWINYYTLGVIPHAHIHVLPRFEDIATVEYKDIIPPKITIDKNEMKKIAEKISERL